MGLIKAAVGAIGSTLHDQWKEAIRCEDMGNDILMMKVTDAMIWMIVKEKKAYTEWLVQRNDRD